MHENINLLMLWFIHLLLCVCVCVCFKQRATFSIYKNLLQVNEKITNININTRFE